MRWPAKIFFLWILSLFINAIIFYGWLGSSEAALAGDGYLLKRSQEKTCHACHKTNLNTPSPGQTGYVQSDWDNAIKMHSAELLGSCSNSTYKTRTACLNAGGSWTPGKWNVAPYVGAGWGVAGGKYGEFACTTCHTPHDTKNIYLMRETVTSPNQPIDNFPGSAVDFRVKSGTAGVTVGTMGDDALPHNPSAKVCEACHSQNKYHNSNVALNTDNTHNNAVDCTTCHSHKQSFKGLCNVCHDIPPTAGGQKHLTHFGAGSASYGSTNIQSTAAAYSFNCGTCHNGGHLNSNPPNPRTVEVVFSGTATQDGATAAAYTPSAYSVDSPAGSNYTFNYSNGTCSNVYCHGNYPGSGKNASPTFVSGTAVCGSCHEASNTTVPPSGSHSKHAASTNYNFPCTRCHNNVISGTGPSSYTIADKSKHVNGYIDWAFDSFASATAAYNISSGTAMPSDGTVRVYSNCSNTYCHSNGTSVLSGTIPANSSPTWGSAGPLACNSCHGNTTYSDYRKASPLYPNGSPKRNSHYYHTSQQATPADEITCYNCHGATINSTNNGIANTSKHVNGVYDVVGGGSYWDFGDVNQSQYATVYPVTIGSYDQTTGKCSNVSCHPAAPVALKSWDSSAYLCTDCHIMNLQDTTMYHHSIFSSNTTPTYPTDSPDGDATTGNFPQNRKCLMCHVDHDIFSPLLNTNSPGRSSNLRTSIYTLPVKTDTTTFANSDYNATGGGICVSCHQQERIKDQSIQRTESNNTRTPVITNADFSVSKHQYTVPSYFTNTGAQFNADCTKCHDTQEDEPNTFQGNYVANTNKFGVHKGDIRRLQAHLGIVAPAETEEEDLCYRCHSKSTDSNPGGGPAKGTANKDWFGVAGMSSAAEDIYTVMQRTGSAAGPTSKTNTLYFRPTASGETPSSPTPTSHQTGDVFSGGTWIGRSMNPWTNATAYETENITLITGTNNNYRGITFVSPAVYTATTIPSGTWTIGIYCRESNTGASAYVRYMIYKWNANNTFGATIVAAGNGALQMATTAAPGAARTIAVTGSAVTLNVGDKIAVDVEVRASSTSSTYTASYYFGNGAQGNLVIPSYVEFNYANPGQVGYGHNVQLYTGLHKPSNYDENLAYISNNKHIECTDCHNMHAAAAEKHSDAGTASSATANTLTDTTKVWTANQWQNATLAIITGTGSGQTKTISSNTSTQITVSSNWTTTPSNTSTYKIVTGSNAASNVLKGVSGAVINSSQTNTLFLRNTTPTGAQPTSSQSGDTFQGGTWQIRDMSAAQGSAAQSQTISITNNSNPGYWRGTSFISPPLTAAASFTAGQTWTLRLWAQENTTGANAYMRASIYVWRANNTKGAVIVAPTTYSTQLTATNTAYTWNLTGSAAALSVGDRIIVELEIESRAGSGNNATYRWNGSGTTNDAKLTLPSGISIGAASSNWTAPTYTLGSATREYEICFKCHSGANANVTNNWGGNAPTGAAAWTDLGLEFNPGNKSFHPVVAALNSTGSGSSALAAGELANGWTPGKTMYCNDCHDTDSAVSRGPHGSATKWMLAGVNKAWPYTSAASNGTSSGTFFTYNTYTTNQNTVNGLFCLNCHNIASSSTPHTADSAHQSIACVGCHIRVPHGGKVSRLINTNTAGRVARYAPDGNGGGTIYLNAFVKPTGSYQQSNCYSTNGSCGAHSGNNSGETW